MVFALLLIAISIRMCACIKNPWPTTEECKLDHNYVIHPDPHDCRLTGGTFCCNELYKGDFERKKAREWEIHRARLEKLNGRSKSVKRPPTPPEPEAVDFANFNFFEGVARKSYTTTRPRTGKLRIQTFDVVCWLTINDEQLKKLLNEDYHGKITDYSQTVRRSHWIKIKCNEKEEVEMIPMQTRRQWADKNEKLKMKHPGDHFEDARCRPMSDEAWDKFQTSLRDARSGIGKRRNYITTRRKRPVQWNHGINIEPGGVIQCSSFRAPKRSKKVADSEGVEGLEVTIGMEDDIQSEALIASNNLIEPHTVDSTLGYRYTARLETASSSSTYAIPYEEPSEFQQQLFQEYDEAMRWAASQEQWDYPELYDTVDAGVAAVPVQEMHMRLVSRAFPLGEQGPTLLEQSIGPTSYLSTEIPSRLVHEEIAPAASVVQGQNALHNDFQACVTSYLDGPPMRLSTEFLPIEWPRN